MKPVWKPVAELDYDDSSVANACTRAAREWLLQSTRMRSSAHAIRADARGCLTICVNSRHPHAAALAAFVAGYLAREEA